MLSLSANAQKEMRWEDVTALHLAATNNTDKENTPHRYLLFDEAVLNRNKTLMQKYQTFVWEYEQNFLNQRAPEGLKVYDQTIADFKQKMKELPDMADQLRESIKQMEVAKEQFIAEYSAEATSYTHDPSTLLQSLTKIAVNQKVYYGYKDIDGGLFAVKTQENGDYTWGAIDYSGQYVIEAKHSEFNVCKFDNDIIFLQTKDSRGAVRAGACGYDGRIRIPFIYDYRADLGYGTNFCVMAKGGKFGFVDFNGKVLQPCEFGKPEYFAYGWSVSKDGKNYGVIDYREAKLVIPLKYKCYWDCGNGEIQMQRHDRKLDVYDKTFKFVRTENAPKD